VRQCRSTTTSRSRKVWWGFVVWRVIKLKWAKNLQFFSVYDMFGVVEIWADVDVL